jgi:hypothetical protein
MPWNRNSQSLRAIPPQQEKEARYQIDGVRGHFRRCETENNKRVTLNKRPSVFFYLLGRRGGKKRIIARKFPDSRVRDKYPVKWLLCVSKNWMGQPINISQIAHLPQISNEYSSQVATPTPYNIFSGGPRRTDPTNIMLLMLSRAGRSSLGAMTSGHYLYI